MRKKINFEDLSLKNDYAIDNFIKEGGISMEFIDIGRGKFLVRNSNGIIVNEKERLEMEKQGLVIKDIDSDTCVKETTKKISKINKRIKEIEEETKEVEVEDDTIKEADTTV